MFVRLLFFQVREKPRVRLTDSNCTDIFVSRHSPHELELKLEGQGNTNIGVGMFWGATMCICFGLIYPISATVSRRKFVLSEPTVFVAVKGASCSLSEKQDSQRRNHEVYVSTITTQAYCRDSRVAQILTIAAFFWIPALKYLSNC